MAILNGLTFQHDDRTDEVRARDADLVFFGNSFHERASRFELRGIHLVRNPINLIASAYFSHRNSHPTDNWPELVKQRALLESVDVDDGLYLTIPFLERADINAGAVGPLFALRTWDYDDDRFLTLRIEDLTADARSTLQGVPALRDLVSPPAELFSFAAMSGGRMPGEVDDHSHYRSGAPDEWKKHTATLLGYVRTFLPELVARHYPEVALHGVDLRQPFYDLDETSRLALTYSAIATRGTVLSRWQALGVAEAGDWDARAATAASMLNGCACVVDLGCGTMSLERYLSKGTEYRPVDVVARDRRTTVVDFNRAELGVDGEAAASLGLLEYILDVNDLVRQCRGRFRVLVVTYNCMRPGDSLRKRRGHAWVNDLTEEQLEAIFRMQGFSVDEKVALENSEHAQFMWKLT